MTSTSLSHCCSLPVVLTGIPPWVYVGRSNCSNRSTAALRSSPLYILPRVAGEETGGMERLERLERLEPLSKAVLPANPACTAHCAPSNRGCSEFYRRRP